MIIALIQLITKVISASANIIYSSGTVSLAIWLAAVLKSYGM